MSGAPSSVESLAAAIAADVLDSFEKLAVVVALCDQPRGYTLDELQLRTGLDRAALTEAIDGLCERGVLERTGARLVIPSGKPWAVHCHAVAALHHLDRARVATLMAQAALRRLRDRARGMLSHRGPDAEHDEGPDPARRRTG